VTAAGRPGRLPQWWLDLSVRAKARGLPHGRARPADRPRATDDAGALAPARPRSAATASWSAGPIMGLPARAIWRQQSRAEFPIDSRPPG